MRFAMQAIPVKEAVRHAKQSLIELYADDPPKALALEEIAFVRDGGRDLWSVTLGFDRTWAAPAADEAGPALANPGWFAQPVEHRIYKTVFIDAATGEFVKMDIRQIQ
jgi:hypothetical protein